MPRYFFDLDDNGEMHPDNEGIVCSSFAAAKSEAIRGLADLTSDTLPNGDHHLFRIKVRDEAGRSILQVAIHFDVESED